MGVGMCMLVLMGMGIQNVYGNVDKELCAHGVTQTEPEPSMLQLLQHYP